MVLPSGVGAGMVSDEEVRHNLPFAGRPTSTLLSEPPDVY